VKFLVKNLMKKQKAKLISKLGRRVGFMCKTADKDLGERVSQKEKVEREGLIKKDSER